VTKLSQNLYITYSNQKLRDLKQSKILKPLDRVVTLDSFILEQFESSNFETIIDESIGSSILYKIIQEENIEYFSYLNADAGSLRTIYSFLLKCARNEVAFTQLLEDEKLNAIVLIAKVYREYKEKYNLVDLADIELKVLESWDDTFTAQYEDIYVDSFEVEDISYVKSSLQEKILKKLQVYKQIKKMSKTVTPTKIIKPSNEVFDNIDEVKTALRITRKLLEDGVKSDEILIVASDIQEYAPLYKLFLDEYALKGYSSLGTSLSSFHNDKDERVASALSQYNSKVASFTALYEKLDLSFSTTAKEALKKSITVTDEKVGIEITEANQIVGLSKKYEHIIFIGTDINHFPPKASDNFLYSYDDELKYFGANNYFTSSQTQLNELKRLGENLYIITASYSAKRELTPSILIGKSFDDTIDISDVKSLQQLALEAKTELPDSDTQAYYESISSETLGVYDGKGVAGMSARHLSASQINKYLSCPLSYLYGNKIRVQAPKQDEEGFDVMQQGSLMHLCYELFGRYIKEKSIKSVDRRELSEIMFNLSLEAYNSEETTKNRGTENIHHQIFLTTLQAGLLDDREPGLLAKFIDYYIENAEEFAYFANSEFEKEFALDENLAPYKLEDKDDKNYFIRGFIDRFDLLDDYIGILDYKSKKMDTKIDKDKMKEIAELKDVQLALYILYASQAYPKKEYYSSLLSFKGGRKSYHFANLSSDAEEADTEHYSREYEKRLREVVFDTKSKIENGSFGFNSSDEKVCGYCDIRYICHESVLSKIN